MAHDYYEDTDGSDHAGTDGRQGARGEPVEAEENGRRAEGGEGAMGEAAEAADEERRRGMTLGGDDLERERMRLAACTAAALGNTPEAAAKRLPRESPYWSVSYNDVCNAVDREIALRERNESLLRDWRIGDEALQAIWGALGIDGDPLGPATIAERVIAELEELRAAQKARGL